MQPGASVANAPKMRQFDEAMKEHMAMTERMRWKLDELGVDWE